MDIVSKQQSLPQREKEEKNCSGNSLSNALFFLPQKFSGRVSKIDEGCHKVQTSSLKTNVLVI